MAQAKSPRRTTPRTENQVGNYRFVRLIAEGGMGQVYEVKHVELGRRAALKMLRPDIAQNEETASRFFTEARAMSLVQHPALIHVYEYGHLDDGGAYIIMEYVEGDLLRELLGKRGGKLPAIVAVGLARQIAAALLVAHDKGIIHRDLKPENIKLVSGEEASMESQIKILDFGIAKTFDTAPEAQHLQTRPGQMLGTPTYMAPEQAGGPGGIGAHTDVYALGIVLFEMLSGQPPFTGEEVLQVVGKHLFSEPPRLSAMLPDTNLELDDLVNRMLSKSPATRPSMRDVKAQLGKIATRIREDATRSTVELQNTSQAETFILRRSTPSIAPTRRSQPVIPISFQRNSLLLGTGILLLGLIALGTWLLLGRLPSNGASIDRVPPSVGGSDGSLNQRDRNPVVPRTSVEKSETLGAGQPLSEGSDTSSGTRRRSLRLAAPSRGSSSLPVPVKPLQDKSKPRELPPDPKIRFVD